MQGSKVCGWGKLLAKPGPRNIKHVVLSAGMHFNFNMYVEYHPSVTIATSLLDPESGLHANLPFLLLNIR